MTTQPGAAWWIAFCFGIATGEAVEGHRSNSIDRSY
jgi:hypothetical protein